MNRDEDLNREPTPDLDSVVPLVHGKDPPGQTEEFKQAHLRARQYLQAFKWVSAIEREYLGACIDGVIYVLLFKIRPAQPEVDAWTWVIVGDLPPAYLTCEDCRTPFEALDGYIGAMEEWVAAAREGKSVAGLIPVNVPATPDNAEMLGRRLEFLEREIMPLLSDDD